MATVTDITLSNDSKVEVKRLGLFEIEQSVGRPDFEPYHIEGEINGKPYRQIYILDYERPEPTKPFDECEEGSSAYWDWLEWHNWQDGLAYLSLQMDKLSTHFAQVEAYILSNCISEDDAKLIETWDDWDAVYHAAIPDLPTMAEIEAMAEHVYQAKWGEAKAFEAYQSLGGSDGSYSWLPKQISDLMVRLGDTTDEFLGRSKHEITFLMAGRLMEPIMSALQNDKQYREMKANRDANS